MLLTVRLDKLRSSLLLGAVVASAGLIAQPAAAQQAGNGAALETVVVTGTLIGRNDLQTPSPIQVISASDIQAQGLTSVADVVRSISADNAGSLSDAFNGAFATGAAAVSLRGLTSADTLILINGHRTSNYPLADDGERVFATLEARNKKGYRFRNTEIWSFRHGKLVEAEVYFGWTLPHEAPPGGFTDTPKGHAP